MRAAPHPWWAPQHSALEPEHPDLTASRARGNPVFRQPRLLSPERLDNIASSLEKIERLCESPIERQFGIAFVIAASRLNLRVTAQYPLLKYRYDFAVLHPTLDQVLALIECDGKAFHSSPDQLANDKKKDTAAEEIGAFVIRYTGTAIMRETEECAQNALGIIIRAWKIPAAA